MKEEWQVNITSPRAQRSVTQISNEVDSVRLETSETARQTAPVRFGSGSGLRALLSLFSCLTLGMTLSVVATAQGAEKTADKKTETKAEEKKAEPAAPAGPAPGAVTYSGLLDGYYQINFQRKNPNPTRAFDYHNNFGFSLAELNVTRTAGKGLPFGFTGTFTLGDTPPVVQATEPGNRDGFKNIQQLYLTYTPHLLGRDVAIDFGKFVTSFGNEVIESTSNDHYSRGLLFFYAIPFYHAGFRFATPISSKISFTGGIVNGWNNVREDNDAKSFFVSFAWNPNSIFSGVFNYMGGAEGVGTYGSVATLDKSYISTNLYEFVPTFKLGSKLKLVGDIVLGDGAGTTPITTGNTTINGRISGNWLGLAAYAKYQWSPQIATALRVEQFEDMPGAGNFGLRTGNTGYTKLRSFTVTAEYAAFHSKLITRLEYRHDKTSQNFFGTGKSDQDTLSLSEAYKF